MKNTSKYFFILILTISLSGKAQNSDTIVFRPMLTLGYDVSGYARLLLEPEVFMHGFSASYEWKPNWMGAIEVGSMNIDITRDSHQYTSRGIFFRGGVNYNLLQKRPAFSNDEVFLSLRYGFGSLNQQAPFIIIYDPYWGSLETSLDPARYSAHWAEIGGGLKTKLFWNIYLGWDLRIKVLLAQKSDIDMEPYVISGYGKNRGNSAVMVHYSFFYKFPVIKK